MSGVRYLITCRKQLTEDTWSLWSEWWPTGAAAEQAQTELLAQAYWDVVSMPLPVMVRSDRRPLAAGGWNVRKKQLALL